MMEAIKATDYLGNELCIDDTVLYVRLNYREFRLGRITKITKDKVKLVEIGPAYPVEIIQGHKQVVKVLKVAGKLSIDV
jgi:hypothetical protein